MKSMAIMFGDGKVTKIDNGVKIRRTEIIKAGEKSDYLDANKKVTINGNPYAISDPVFYDDASTENPPDDTAYLMVSYYINIKNDTGSYIDISPNSFPGAYYVTADTYARSYVTNEDEFFQLIIPKAKVTSENTLTLEAEGDPSVFNMNLTVLRPDDGPMMRLVKYNLDEAAGADGQNSGSAHVILDGVDDGDDNDEKTITLAEDETYMWVVTLPSAESDPTVKNGDTTITSNCHQVGNILYIPLEKSGEAAEETITVKVSDATIATLKLVLAT